MTPLNDTSNHASSREQVCYTFQTFQNYDFHIIDKNHIDTEGQMYSE